MHYTVNATPCLFKCSACPVFWVSTACAATRLKMSHKEEECAGENQKLYADFSLCFNYDF